MGGGGFIGHDGVGIIGGFIYSRHFLCERMILGEYGREGCP